MLQEVRKIVFPKETLIQYLVKECAASGVEVPISPVEGLSVEGGAPMTIGLLFATAQGANSIHVPLSEAFVLGAMIGACRDYKIPLSRSAEKGLQMHKDSLAMTMVSVTRKPVASTATEMFS